MLSHEGPNTAGSLAGKRILIVEDEYFIAVDLKAALADADAFVVGPTGDLDTALALALASSGPLDAAVLDVNLEDATSFPVAAHLGERGVPYMFLTGYDGWALPEEYRDVPRVAKPFSAVSVLQTAAQLVVAS